MNLTQCPRQTASGSIDCASKKFLCSTKTLYRKPILSLRNYYLMSMFRTMLIKPSVSHVSTSGYSCHGLVRRAFAVRILSF